MEELEQIQLLKRMHAELVATNRRLQMIATLLGFAAVGAFFTGRAAIIEHGFWKILGF